MVDRSADERAALSLTGRSWNSPSPLASGKSGTRCDRMQFAHARALEITLVAELACAAAAVSKKSGSQQRDRAAGQ